MKRRSLAGFILVCGAAALLLWLLFRPADETASAPTSAAPREPAGVETTPPAPDAPRAGDDEEPGLAPVPPALATELTRLLALSDPDERFRKLDEFWRRWFALDPAGVFAAISGLPPGDERAQALLYAVLELAPSDPDRALDLALLLVRDERDASLFASLFDLFARQDLGLARERLARVPPPRCAWT